MRSPSGIIGRYFACIRRRSSRFGRDERGVAAVEFAVIAPILAFAMIAMVDIGEAVYTKYDIERKMRLTIEGVVRYGDDPEKVLAFANASGATAFKSKDNVAENKSGVAIKSYYVCRDIEKTYDTLDEITCPNYETWYNIGVTGSVNTLFGKTFDLQSTTQLLVE